MDGVARMETLRPRKEIQGHEFKILTLKKTIITGMDIQS
jgi:hypothetical protein